MAETSPIRRSVHYPQGRRQVRRTHWVDLTVGTALAADWTTFDIYPGNDFRIDV